MITAFGGLLRINSGAGAAGSGNGACEGCGGCGVRVPALPSCHMETPNGWCVVERCDVCEVYDSDYCAALAISDVVRAVPCDSGGSHVLARLVGRHPPRSFG